MNSTNEHLYQSAKLIIGGSLIAAVVLAVLLIARNTGLQSTLHNAELWFITSVIATLGLAGYLLFKKHLASASWVLFSLYFLASFTILLFRGIGTPAGLLILGFTIIIPSVLLGPRFTLPAVSISLLLLIVVHLFHTAHPTLPLSNAPTPLESHWKIFIYATILSIVGLISWISSRQRDKSLKRALDAEAQLQIEKDSLKDTLAEESQKLRLAQLKQINELHTFAALGQATAATLHDLSNHLNILNLEIEDLGSQRENSASIMAVRRSLQAMHTMIQESRQQLGAFEQHTIFDAGDIIRQSIKNVRYKYKQQGVRLARYNSGNRVSPIITGNAYALTQIITILLNNALDACHTAPSPEVSIRMKSSHTHLTISVLDNGTGISPTAQAQLFEPKASTKATGLGIGLYLARHLTQSVFSGTLELTPSSTGAHFQITIPRPTNA